MSRFDEAASRWDESSDRIQLAHVMAQAFKQAIPMDLATVLMDLGAGTGLISLELHQRVKTVYAVDTSVGMLEQLFKKIKAQGLQKLVPYLWDVTTSEPFPHQLDAIVSGMTFHHLPDIHYAAQRLYHLLAPGGRLAVVDLEQENGDFHGPSADVYHFGFQPDEIREWVEGAGFKTLSLATFHRVKKVTVQGEEKEFPLFLLTAQRPEDS